MGTATTLEAMCGHLAHLADVLLQRGSNVELSNLERRESAPAHAAGTRYREICDALSSANADRATRFAAEIEAMEERALPGSTVLILLTSAEEGVASAIRRLAERRKVHVLLYDPGPYPKEKIVVIFLTCTDKDFIASLASQNVRLSIMPYPYASERQVA
jgi:hypothetical protein